MSKKAEEKETSNLLTNSLNLLKKKNESNTNDKWSQREDKAGDNVQQWRM